MAYEMGCPKCTQSKSMATFGSSIKMGLHWLTIKRYPWQGHPRHRVVRWRTIVGTVRPGNRFLADNGWDRFPITKEPALRSCVAQDASDPESVLWFYGNLPGSIGRLRSIAADGSAYPAVRTGSVMATKLMPCSMMKRV